MTSYGNCFKTRKIENTCETALSNNTFSHKQSDNGNNI